MTIWKKKPETISAYILADECASIQQIATAAAQIIACAWQTQQESEVKLATMRYLFLPNEKVNAAELGAAIRRRLSEITDDKDGTKKRTVPPLSAQYLAAEEGLNVKVGLRASYIAHKERTSALKPRKEDEYKSRSGSSAQLDDQSMLSLYALIDYYADVAGVTGAAAEI